jgi:hypothetical protein
MVILDEWYVVLEGPASVSAAVRSALSSTVSTLLSAWVSTVEEELTSELGETVRLVVVAG